MENMMFKRVEVTGTTKEEAFAKAPFTAPIDKWFNATQKYTNWVKKQDGAITDADVKQFMLDYIKEKKIAPGQAAYIVKTPAVADSRERPYKFENIKTEGSRKFKREYRWIDTKTGEIVAKVNTNKADAFNVLKKAYTDKGYRGNAELTPVMVCVEGNPILAKAYYTPSKNTQCGVFAVFGIITD